MTSKQKSKIFIRKRKIAGIYCADFDGHLIKIVDRGIYTARNSAEIKFLSSDPELEEYETSKPELDKIISQDVDVVSD